MGIFTVGISAIGEDYIGALYEEINGRAVASDIARSGAVTSDILRQAGVTTDFDRMAGATTDLVRHVGVTVDIDRMAAAAKEKRMANEYHKGNQSRISNAFTVNSVATDPTTVTLTVHKPDGTSTPYTYALGQVMKESTGNYYKDVDLDQAGIWHYKWEGTGACQAVDEGWLEVVGSAF